MSPLQVVLSYLFWKITYPFQLNNYNTVAICTFFLHKEKVCNITVWLESNTLYSFVLECGNLYCSWDALILNAATLSLLSVSCNSPSITLSDPTNHALQASNSALLLLLTNTRPWQGMETCSLMTKYGLLDPWMQPFEWIHIFIEQILSFK